MDVPARHMHVNAVRLGAEGSRGYVKVCSLGEVIHAPFPTAKGPVMRDWQTT